MATKKIECYFMGKIGEIKSRPGVIWVQFYDLNFDTKNVENLLKLYYQRDHGRILIEFERQNQHDSKN